MRDFLIVILLGFIIITINSCGQIDSNQVDQQEIYPAYNASFDGDKNTIEFKASFSVGGSIGTQVWLKDESSISINNSKLSGDSNIFNQISYSYKKKNPANNLNYNIIYKNNDGETYTNNMSIPGAVHFKAPAVAYRSEGLIVHWNLENGFAGDTLDVWITTTSNSENVATERLISSNGTTYISPESLEGLTEGSFKVKLCRSRTSYKIQSPTIGGHLCSSFCTKSKTIVIEE